MLSPPCPTPVLLRRFQAASRWFVAAARSACALLFVCVAGFATLASVSAAEAARPNFIFIFTDDQRFDALGVVQREQGDRARFPWFKTPHLDRLASEGLRFRNAFVVSSLCSPSRAVFLTGRYNHFNGIANNRTAFPTNSVTHATLLRAAGYVTGYAGKWHMGQQSGQRPGFDFSASFVGQGRFHDCPFEVNGARTNTTGWVDDVTTDFALDFMKRNRDKPFLLVVGYKSPHGPRHPPARWTNAFANEVAQPPLNAAFRPPYATNPPAPAIAGRAAPRRDEALLNYFRCIAAVDENVGRILKALDDAKLADNTVVIFTSDNGFYLGEHGLGDKRSAYDESLRIPLLVRYPKLVPKPRVIDAMALNTDLAPTLLDLAGVAIPKEMQGRSWKPLLTGTTPDNWRRAFFYEYFREANLGPPSVVAVRTETHKLIKYPGHDDWTELFDLKTDPFETNNLARNAVHSALLDRMKTEFETQAKAVDYHVPPYADEIAGGPPPAANRPNARQRRQQNQPTRPTP